MLFPSDDIISSTDDVPSSNPPTDTTLSSTDDVPSSNPPTDGVGATSFTDVNSNVCSSFSISLLIVSNSSILLLWAFNDIILLLESTPSYNSFDSASYEFNESSIFFLYSTGIFNVASRECIFAIFCLKLLIFIYNLFLLATNIRFTTFPNR